LNPLDILEEETEAGLATTSGEEETFRHFDESDVRIASSAVEPLFLSRCSISNHLSELDICVQLCRVHKYNIPL
jgi:hypothetical protein